MSWLRRITVRRASLRHLPEEIQTHLDERIEALVAAGLTGAEAAAQARRELGNPTTIEEQARDVWRWPVVETFLGDLRHAARTLAKAPGFTAATVLTLALGMGANAAVFSVVNAVLLRPLPFPAPQELVRVFSLRDGLTTGPSALDVRDFARESRSFEHLVAYDTWRKNLAVPGHEPEQIRVGLVPAEYFLALGIPPLVGRLFSEEENRWGAHHVAIVSSSFRAEHFGKGDPLGRTITLNEEPFVVVGVVPDVIPGWMDPTGSTVRVWTPFAPSPDVWDESGRGDRSGRGFSTVGRLRPGVSLEQARADLRAVATDLARRYPVDQGVGVTVEPLLGSRVATLRPTLSLLMAAVGLILLLAGFNTTSLLIARNGTRRQELAIRTALGAGRFRLACQLVAETLLLTSLGAIAGLGLAALGTHVLAQVGPERIPQLAEARLDVRVLAFAVLTVLVTALAVGTIPALIAAPTNPGDILRAGGRAGSSGAGQRRLRQFLVTGEVSLALVLLVGAGLLVKGLVRLQERDLGFQRGNLLTEHLYLPEGRYGSPERITRFCDAYAARIRSLPGVSEASITDVIPPTYRWRMPFTVVGEDPPPPEAVPTANFGVTDTHYLRTLGLRLLRGRDFSESDVATSPRVVLVNETFARRFFPGTDPIGRRLEVDENQLVAGARPVLTVIGVLGDTPNRGVNEDPDPDMIGLFRQNPEQNFGFKSVVLRTTVTPGRVIPELRSALRALDPDLPFAEVRTMEEIVAREATEGRFASWLFGAFAVLGLALAIVGVYGLVSYLVTQRDREIAIRFALGARRMDVVQLVAREGLQVGLLGIALGLLGAFASARLASSLLYGLSPRDPLTFGASAGSLAVILALAVLLPCRRAIRIEAQAALLVEGE
jgi:putative ABC transport system permease protein